MPRYVVHLFAVVRVQVPAIEAANHREAIAQATAQVEPSLSDRFASADSEYAEEISHYLVDLEGDSDHRQSRWFYSESDPLLANLRRLVAWYDLPQADDDELERIIADAREAIELAV